MIFDGEKIFPRSSVVFTRFRSYGTRETFAYLRQAEQILQREQEELTPKSDAWFYVTGKLHMIEAALSYMVGNIDTEFVPQQLGLPGF